MNDPERAYTRWQAEEALREFEAGSVEWVGRGCYMVKTSAGQYGPWDSRPQAQKWLEARRARAAASAGEKEEAMTRVHKAPCVACGRLRPVAYRHDGPVCTRCAATISGATPEA